MQSSQPQSSIPRTLAVLGLVVAVAATMMAVLNAGLFAGAGDAAGRDVEVVAGAETETVPATVTTAGGSYTVQSGDTLDTIARKHETTIEVLVNLNPGINDPYNLMPGTRLAVP